MARLPTNSDAFSAIAEPDRRRLLLALRRGEQSVGSLSKKLKLNQPQTSKHLRVLKSVGLVVMRADGQRRLYKLNGTALKPVRDWVMSFEQFWAESFDRLDEHLKKMQSKGNQN